MDDTPESPAQNPRLTFRHRNCSRFDLAHWAARRTGLEVIGRDQDEPDTLILASSSPEDEAAYFADYRKLLEWSCGSD